MTAPPLFSAFTALEVPGVVVDMKQPQLHELTMRLRFAPDEGRIWMDDRRLVLMQAETFAQLRQALLEQLGLEATRQLLSRLYFAAGQRDAESAIRALGPQASRKELLDTGGRMHALHGYLLPEHVGIGLAAGDLRSDDYYGEAIWKDTLEDEIHVAQHGIGEQSACWGAVGYCSGYLSRCAERLIVVREVQCRATGSSHCKIVAQPAERWPNAAQEDLYYLLPAQLTQPQAATSASSPAPHSTTAAHPPSPPIHPLPKLEAGQEFVGTSTAFHVLEHKVQRVAPTQATVLLLGESGSGKSLLAREVHRRSQRAQAQFIEVNCAAIPEQLLESELFGVERGAFSGANHSRPGRFEAAHQGTLFLDEIATLSMTAQGKLLRVLQSGAMERLGSNQTIITDVRLIAATNENLKHAVQQGKFREDLYFRLNVFPIAVPPLRERRSDIPLLVAVLLQRFAQRHGRNPQGISTRAMHALMHHHWPGNVRELENVVERAIIMLQGQEVLDVRHLSSADDVLASPSYFGLDPRSGQLASHDMNEAEVDAGSSMSTTQWAEQAIAQGQGQLPALEDALVRAALAHTGGNISQAAHLLGITRAQLDYRHKKMGLA